MMTRLRDRRRLREFQAEQREKDRQETARSRRQRPPRTSEARSDDDEEETLLARWPGMTWDQARQAQALLELANRERGRLKGARYAGRIGGIRGVVLRGLVGDSSLGYRLRGHRGGRAMKLHGLHILKENQPRAVRAAVIARRQLKAAAAFERDRAREVPLPVSSRSRSFLEL